MAKSKRTKHKGKKKTWSICRKQRFQAPTISPASVPFQMIKRHVLLHCLRHHIVGMRAFPDICSLLFSLSLFHPPRLRSSGTCRHWYTREGLFVLHSFVPGIQHLFSYTSRLCFVLILFLSNHASKGFTACSQRWSAGTGRHRRRGHHRRGGQRTDRYRGRWSHRSGRSTGRKRRRPGPSGQGHRAGLVEYRQPTLA